MAATLTTKGGNKEAHKERHHISRFPLARPASSSDKGIRRPDKLITC